MTAQTLGERSCSCDPDEVDLPVALLSVSVHETPHFHLH